MSRNCDSHTDIWLWKCVLVGDNGSDNISYSQRRGGCGKQGGQVALCDSAGSQHPLCHPNTRVMSACMSLWVIAEVMHEAWFLSLRGPSDGRTPLYTPQGLRPGQALPFSQSPRFLLATIFFPSAVFERRFLTLYHGDLKFSLGLWAAMLTWKDNMLTSLCSTISRPLSPARSFQRLRVLNSPGMSQESKRQEVAQPMDGEEIGDDTPT